MLERLDRLLDDLPAAGPAALAALDEPDRQNIGQVAADLRRLDQFRLGVAATSPAWYDAILQAYDDRLRVACHYLGVAEYLDRVSGLDLEIERVRVEGELRALGLFLRGDPQRGQTP